MSKRGRDTSSSLHDASKSKRASHWPGCGTDLAYVHHTGYADFVLKAAPGLLRILRQSKLRRGLVVDLGRKLPRGNLRQLAFRTASKCRLPLR